MIFDLNINKKFVKVNLIFCYVRKQNIPSYANYFSVFNVHIKLNWSRVYAKLFFKLKYSTPRNHKYSETASYRMYLGENLGLQRQTNLNLIISYNILDSTNFQDIRQRTGLPFNKIRHLFLNSFFLQTSSRIAVH